MSQIVLLAVAGSAFAAGVRMSDGPLMFVPMRSSICAVMIGSSVSLMQRMLDDMTMRKLAEKTQITYIRAVAP